jgi:gamma-glutamyltranspeptidase/glutathione hydrolase
MSASDLLPNRRLPCHATGAIGALMLWTCVAFEVHGQAVPRPEQRVVARGGVVAAAHPRAAEAGVAMLQAGGNAVDAAVATAFALGVLEPMMAGVGGGGAMTLWMAGTREAWHVDFYASAGGEPDYALDDLAAEEVGDSLVTPEQWAAVPGTVAGLLAAHERFGRLSREQVMRPAIRLARDGFVVRPFLAQVIGETRAKLSHSPGAAALFYPEGEALQAGDRLVQQGLAATLERIAQLGRDGFYRGPVAEAVVGTLRAGGNSITLGDLSGYEARWRRPLCGTYRGHLVLTAPPPLAGVQVLEALNLLASEDFSALGPPTRDPVALGTLVDAIRIARADAGGWIGDPRDAGVPAVGLASPAYAVERSALMALRQVPDSLAPGDPWDEEHGPGVAACRAVDHFPPTAHPRPEEEPRRLDGGAAEEGETTHLSVMDGAGNAVSLTFTLGAYFGYGAYAAGAFFNDANENFGGPWANHRGPYRTPRTQTTPTLVLHDGRVKMVVGSPGGGRIAPAIIQAIVYALDYGLDPWTVVHMPRVYPFTDEPVVRLEVGFTAEAVAPLRDRGYDVEVLLPYDRYFGGLHIVVALDDGTLIGAADPRRDGAALGY